MTRAILLDIEGTTTPIDFVHRRLFPFAKEHIGMFISQNLETLNDVIAQLRAEYKKDFLDQIYGRDFDEYSPESITQYLTFLIDIDRKSTPLKALQGEIWKSGYESGKLRSIVYADAARAMKRWHAAGVYIAIYSSGSVQAQKLLFRYSDRGDLTGLVSAYFDTRTGAKRKPASYRRIASAEAFPQVENSIFISDTPAELDAARAAGFQTLLSVREGNPPVVNSEHKIIRSFDEIE